jgi:formylglycine-generating enzyme required for sulfatase activity
MSRIFLSHSSKNNAEAKALADWLAAQGFDDLFLDLNPQRGIAAGERWERALNQAAQRCEAVLFLVSNAWLASDWCLKEFNLAHRLNKRLFGVLIEDIPIASLPVTLTGTWQLVPLVLGRDHIMLRAVLPTTHEEVHVTFSQEGLTRLKIGLERAGLDPKFFAWPPENDPGRAPYRGLRPLEAEDAGIFFGREAATIGTLDRLRGLSDTAPPRFLVILGASGAGKSSYLRAGVLPKLARDDRHFLPLPVVRPEHAAINGEYGLLRVLEKGFADHGVAMARADIREAIANGAAGLRPLLAMLVEKALVPLRVDDPHAKPPVLVLPIDQGEELFQSEGLSEGQALLNLLAALLAEDAPAMIAMVAIRIDAYEKLQAAKPLEGVEPRTESLRPMPRTSYQAVVEGPAGRLADTNRALPLEPALTQALLADVEAGGGRDALPLLAFTLERLYLEFGARGRLTLDDYKQLGGIKGSIEAAVERALKAADGDPRIPANPAARLTLLRRGLIPWLAGIDPETSSPRRRIARKSQIPEEARPLIDLLVEQRLLLTDVAPVTGEVTIEPAHEALLRQWGLLQGWLVDDAGDLGLIESVEHAAADWKRNDKHKDWFVHSGIKLRMAEHAAAREDFRERLSVDAFSYLSACRSRQRVRRLKVVALFWALAAVAIGGATAWRYQRDLSGYAYWLARVRGYVLSADRERALHYGETFRECADCPIMILLPPGTFKMGSPPDEGDNAGREYPLHGVVINSSFAVGKSEVTFAEWDACALHGPCDREIVSKWGRDQNPVINVTWDDTKQYVEWLSKITGKPYRLLSEAEFEYAARAGAQTAYSWGNSIGNMKAQCAECDTLASVDRPNPVCSFSPNKFGICDTAGNLFQWVDDCFHANYVGAPSDGTPWLQNNCERHVVRGGSWLSRVTAHRSAFRDWRSSGDRRDDLGFRVARTLKR